MVLDTEELIPKGLTLRKGSIGRLGEGERGERRARTPHIGAANFDPALPPTSLALLRGHKNIGPRRRARVLLPVSPAARGKTEHHFFTHHPSPRHELSANHRQNQT